jgi:hypothetical protein
MEITCPSCKVSAVRGHVYLSRAECQYCGAHFEVSQLRGVRSQRRLMSASLPALNQSFTQPQLQQHLQQSTHFSVHRIFIFKFEIFFCRAGSGL